MKVAISHIAWRPEEETEIRALLTEMGIDAVEIAPARVTGLPSDYRKFWESSGIRIVAMQALLFGKPALKLLGNEAERREIAEYLDSVFDLARETGAKALVFGSPRSRNRGDLSPQEAIERAAGILNQIGDSADARGVSFCIEPNPVEYGCDFITRSSEAIDLLGHVKTRGLALHLDGAAMSLSGENLEAVCRALGSKIRHFHVSAPQLGVVNEESLIDYASVFRALNESGYRGFVSIEMRAAEAGSNAPRVRRAIEYVRACLTKAGQC